MSSTSRHTLLVKLLCKRNCRRLHHAVLTRSHLSTTAVVHTRPSSSCPQMFPLVTYSALPKCATPPISNRMWKCGKVSVTCTSATRTRICGGLLTKQAAKAGGSFGKLVETCSTAPAVNLDDILHLSFCC